MKSFKLIPILALIFLGFFLIRGFVYSTNDTNDTSITDSSTIPLESDPRCIAINPFTDQAVVVSVKPNTVSIIDLNTQEVISTIFIGKKPRGVAIDQEQNLALVSSTYDDTLSVINLDTRQMTKTIPVGESPQGVAVDEKSHIALVTNKEDNSVSVIDLPTFRTVKTIRVGKEPCDVATDPGLNLAFVVNKEGNNVSVIDLESYKVMERIPVDKEPRAISINTETHLAAVANEESNSITIINLQNWQTTHIPVKKHPIDVAVNPLDNCALVICDKEKSLLRIDLNTNKIIDQYDINKRSRGVAVNPFTNIAAVVDDKTDSLTLIQLPNPVPEITSLAPNAIFRGSGATRIKIEGSRFIKTSTVSLLPAASLHVDFIDNHHLEVTIPENHLTKAGTYHLIVTNQPPDGGTSNPVDLQVNNPIPSITSLEPGETEAGSAGLTLTIHGTGFFDDTIVSINGTPKGFKLIDQTKFEIPLSATDLEVGAYLNVSAYNLPPGGGQSSPLKFRIKNPVPTLLSISPQSIIAGSPDLKLTLTGDNFVRTSIVSFNNQQVSSSYISKIQVEATIPSDAVKTPGSYPVKVINLAPGGAATSPLTFTVNPPHPNVEPQPEGSFGEKYQDLVPPDATVKSYDPKRFSLITGLVKNLGASPISDISVSILNYPGYGTAKTNAEGRFSVPVEGGTTLTVIFQKEGLLTTHRKVYVPWNDTAIAETIVMIPQDPASTALTFDGNPNTVVTHQSTIVTDDRGSRSSTLVSTGDNRAYSVDASGNVIQALTTITARATEFTTEDSMPAKLPPNSAYTYCVELTVDGTQRVRFDKPVIIWVENFLGFNVGERVPVGYYDRDRGVWVPSENGLVVRLLDTNGDGIVDALDANGDGLPDDLNGNSYFSDEVIGLNNPQRYPPGSAFWRVAVTHFTPWDYNWPYGPPPDATTPNPEGIPTTDQQKKEEHDCREYRASFVETRGRIFHEDIPIPGTDFTLHYTSNRVSGYHQKITVAASGQTVPSSLNGIIVQLNIAGRSYEKVLSPLPNQMAEFIWDGLDILGRTFRGPVTAKVNLGFVYDAVYYSAGNFSQSFAKTGSQVTGIRARQEVISWKQSEIRIAAKTEGIIAEGWTLSTHHYLSPLDPSTLQKGDGTTIKNNTIIIETVAGNGTAGYSGDGGSATQAKLSFPAGTAMDASGNLYIADSGNHRIRKVDTNGVISTLAGTGASGYSGDGGSAPEAKLYFPEGVAVDAGGNLYIADTSNHRIRKVNTNGIITTVAGNGVDGYSGDDGLAIQAKLSNPFDVVVDVSGNVYIADTANNRIRKVDTNGIITTVAGTGTYGYSGDGGPAVQAKIAFPEGVAVDALGNLYIADTSNYCIRKVDPSGIITTVAGAGSYGFSGDGGPATNARLAYPYRVSVDSKGNLYLSDYLNNRVRRVDTSGIITTVAGNGDYSYRGDGGPPTEAGLAYPVGVALDASGNLYIGDRSNQRIRKVTPYFSPTGITANGDIIFTESIGLGHLLTGAGHHKKTIDLETGASLYEFAYDQRNNLISISDRSGNRTLINRDGGGIPTSITSPDGITTTLTIDSKNHLTQINYPDGNSYGFEYTPDGLMTAKIEPKGNRFEPIFDSIGRLTDVTDQEGGHWKYSRAVNESGDISTEVLSAEGNLTSYLDHTGSTGAYTSHITDPSGAETVFSSSADGLTANKTLPCGMTLSLKYGFDSEYKFQFVKEMRERASSGLERVTLREKTYQDTNADSTLDLITEKFTLNGKITTLVNNALQSKRTMTSPLGRTTTTFYNPNNLLTSRLTIPGLYDTDFGYDTRGRLTSITTSARQTILGYDSQGNLSFITDPEDQTTNYTYDSVARLTGILRPDNSSIDFTYDKNGNMTVLTNPSSINHGFGYNKINLNSSYQTPLSGSYSYLYNRDRRLLQLNFPSGKQITNIYDKDRIIQTQTSEGNIDFTYLCGSKVGSITKGTEIITYGYDGSLVTSETLSGTLNHTLSYTYNNDFNLKSFTYAGGTVNYTYDNDGLLTGMGSFTITRNAGNGLPEAVTGGTLNIAQTFNGYGELESQTFSVNSLNLTSWGLSRDKTGRIVFKTETVEGTTSNYVYTYDSMGRLLTVTRDAALIEEYQYDSIRRRTYEMNLLKGISGRTHTYSDEDHLLTAGDITYQYDADGFLTTKTQGSNITGYSYSSRRELLSVTLPDGRVVEYVNDPMGKRIAKKVGGVITEKYLWQGLTRLLAIYDGSNNLVMRFEYADARMSVAMTQGGTTYYLTYDQVDSLRIITDASGNLVKRIDYDSFGSIINDTNPGFHVPFGFAGGLHDRDTGLVTFGFRDYDPDTGRWTAKDPIGFAGGDVNLYGYCLNDPINSLDPDGLLFGGRINAGEYFGEAAALYWATLSINPNNAWYQAAFYDLMGYFASLWTPCTSDATFATLSAAWGVAKWVGRPFWQYYPAENPAYSSPWLSRGWGWKPPYTPGPETAQKLALPPYNPGTAVRPVSPSWWQPVGGPTTVPPNFGQPGGGVQYKIWGWP